MGYKEIILPKDERQHNNLIIMTGVPASGKNFLLEKVVSCDEEIRKAINIIEFSALLFNLLADKHSLGTRDDLSRLLTQIDVLKGVEQAVDIILERLPAVVNTHVVYRQGNKLQTNLDSLEKLNPSFYIYIWSNPDVIFERRKQEQRQRTLETPERIEFHQDTALTVVASIAQNSGAALRTVYNREDNLAENTQLLLEEIKKSVL